MSFIFSFPDPWSTLFVAMETAKQQWGFGAHARASRARSWECRLGRGGLRRGRPRAGLGWGGGGVGPARRAQGARPAPAGVRTGLLVPRGGRGLQGASPKRARPPPLPPPESARSVPGLGRDGGALASLCWGDLPRGEARPGSARCGPRVLWPWSSQGGGAGEKNPPGYHSGLSLCPVPVPVPTKELGPQRQRLCSS